MSVRPIGQYHLPVSDTHPNVAKEGSRPHGIMTTEEFDKFNKGRADAYPEILKRALNEHDYYIDGNPVKGNKLEKQYNYKIKEYIDSKIKDLNVKLKPNLIDVE